MPNQIIFLLILDCRSVSFNVFDGYVANVWQTQFCVLRRRTIFLQCTLSEKHVINVYFTSDIAFVWIY